MESSPNQNRIPQPHPGGVSIHWPAVAMCLCLFMSGQTGFAGGPAAHVYCKYSVRDVAFVNVHGNPWQLQLVKPNGIDVRLFETWNRTLKQKLVDSNVGYIWFDTETSQAKEIQNATGDSASAAPRMQLVRLTGEPRVLAFPADARSGSLDDDLEQLLQSPARQAILDQVSESLCVILLVESGDVHRDRVAQQAAGQAIEQINRQMWTYEKPTDHGPILITVPASQWQRERWLLQSLEIPMDALPAAAIIYGQGRRMGNVLAGDQITRDALVTLAGICGRDCECQLDRHWLYGQQMIHVWQKRHEIAAENSLTFDPRSALVMAEVAQIIQKQGARAGTNQPPDLAGGLVIHDLGPITETTSADGPFAAGETSTSVGNERESIRPASDDDRQPMKTLNDNGATAGEPQLLPGAVPWPLLIVLASITVVVLLALKLKASGT